MTSTIPDGAIFNTLSGNGNDGQEGNPGVTPIVYTQGGGAGDPGHRPLFLRRDGQ